MSSNDSEVQRLRAALIEIVEGDVPRNWASDPFDDGYSCAAEIARKALAESPQSRDKK